MLEITLTVDISERSEHSRSEFLVNNNTGSGMNYVLPPRTSRGTNVLLPFIADMHKCS